MLRITLVSAGLMVLAACDPAALIGKSGGKEPEISCLTRPGSGCTFDHAPLTVLPEPVILPRRPYKFFPTATSLNFVDSRGRNWVAPARTLTDGASIPRIFVSIVGDPTSPEYINAAAVHDAYCGVGNEAGLNYHRAYWEDVHIMFYDGLIVGGAQHLVAKLMFAAVWLGGPRWPQPEGVARVSTQGPALSANGSGYYRSLDHVPDHALQDAMRSAKRFIEQREPTLPELLTFLRLHETVLLREYPVSAPGEYFGPQDEKPHVDEPVDEYDEEGHVEGVRDGPDPEGVDGTVGGHDTDTPETDAALLDGPVTGVLGSGGGLDLGQ